MSRWRERKARFEREEQERRQWCERARRRDVGFLRMRALARRWKRRGGCARGGRHEAASVVRMRGLIRGGNDVADARASQAGRGASTSATVPR